MNSSKDVIWGGIKKRKRTSVKPEPLIQTVNIDNQSNNLEVEIPGISYERKCQLLEAEVIKLMSRVEACKQEVDALKLEKLHLENKIRGVMRHLKTTIEAERISGFRPKLKNRPAQSFLQEQNMLLEWKINVMQKFLEGTFKDLL